MLWDSSTETVLVPQKSLARVRKESVKPTGVFVTGNRVSITESIVNERGMIDGGNDRAVQDLVHSGGAIKVGVIALKADGDIRNASLAVKESYDFGPNSGIYTSWSNVATITPDIMVAATSSTWPTRSTPVPTRR